MALNIICKGIRWNSEAENIVVQNWSNTAEEYRFNDSIIPSMLRNWFRKDGKNPVFSNTLMFIEDKLYQGSNNVEFNDTLLSIIHNSHERLSLNQGSFPNIINKLKQRTLEIIESLNKEEISSITPLIMSLHVKALMTDITSNRSLLLRIKDFMVTEFTTTPNFKDWNITNLEIIDMISIWCMELDIKENNRIIDFIKSEKANFYSS